MSRVIREKLRELELERPVGGVYQRRLVNLIERLLAQEREKVRESFINATCVLCRTGEKPYLQSFGGKNWKGRYQAWVHDVEIEGRVEVQTCPANAIHSLQPAASDLEELLRKERLNELKDWPELCNIVHCNHGRNCMYHSRIAELEKARASGRKG